MYDRLDNRILWIRGGPGIGKSTIAGYLIDIIGSLYSDSTLGYFFCKSGVVGMMAASDIIRTLAYQVALASPSARSILDNLKKRRFPIEEQVGVSLLFDQLIRVPMSHAKAYSYIVLDGIDEVNGEDLDAIENKPQIEVLLECLATLPSCRVIVFSRPPLDLLRLMPTAIVKSMTPKDNESDLRIYIETQIKDLDKLQDHFEKLGVDPVKFFVEKASGIFLWVFLVLHQLRQSSKRSRKILEKDLKDLFEGSSGNQLDKQFSVLLLRRSAEDQMWIRTVLRFVIIGTRDLELDELQSAVETALGDEHYDFRKFLEVKCGAFLQLLPNIEGVLVVQLIHETFASFLLDPDRCQPTNYLVDKEEAHLEMAIVCLDILTSENAESLAFVNYASSFWVEHLKKATKSGNRAAKLFNSLYRFFRSDGVQLWVKHSLSKLPNLRSIQIAVEERALDDIIVWLAGFKPPVPILCRFGESNEESGILQVIKSSDSFRNTNEEPYLTLQQSITWRESLLMDRGKLGKSIGRAAAKLWVRDNLPRFNQIATCFLLAWKYCPYRTENDRSQMELNYNDIRALSSWTHHVHVDLEFSGQFSMLKFEDITWPSKKNMGVAYFCLQQWRECAECFTSCASTEGGDFRTLRYLGEAYNALKRYDSAIETFQLALSQNPTDSLSWMGLSEAYKGIGQYEGAINTLQEGAKQNPGDDRFLKGLGIVFMAKEDYESAIKAIQIALEKNVADSMLWGKLGEAYTRHGNYEEAIATFQAATDRFPLVMRLWEGLRDVYIAGGNNHKAKQTVDNAVQKVPKFAQRFDLDAAALAPLKKNQLHYSNRTYSNRTLGRTVWLINREGSIKYGEMFPSDWAILISPLSRAVVEIALGQHHKPTSEWGDIHELWNFWGTAVYEGRKNIVEAINNIYLYHMSYIGDTKMNHGEIEALGMTL